MENNGASQRRLYRSPYGYVLGVCQGLADYLECPAAAIRILLVIVALMANILVVTVVYFIAAVVMKTPSLDQDLKSPPDDQVNVSDKKASPSRAASPSFSVSPTPRMEKIQRIRRLCEQVEARVQRLEEVARSRWF